MIDNAKGTFSSRPIITNAKHLRRRHSAVQRGVYGGCVSVWASACKLHNNQADVSYNENAIKIKY